MMASDLLQTRVAGDVVDFAPLEGLPGSQWLLLLADGRLVQLDADSGALAALATIDLAALPIPQREVARWQPAPRLHLHVSACGGFAAVVVDGGLHGVVIDLLRGVATLRLECGKYLADTVPFSFAFVVVRGRTLAVHRTDWNRLDLSDPARGELLSARDTPPFRSLAERPPHYLDYFHGALQASPSGRLLLDDGWVWHPAGVSMVVDCDTWLHGNPFETEHGSSLRNVVNRDEWLLPSAWIDEQRIAMGGAMVEVRDIELPEAADPDAEYLPAAYVAHRLPTPADRVFADESSVLTVAADGTRRWSLVDGTCRTHLPGFHPTRFHRDRGELAQLVAGALLRSRHPRGST